MIIKSGGKREDLILKGCAYNVCMYQACLHIMNEIYRKKKRICQMEDKASYQFKKANCCDKLGFMMQKRVAPWSIVFLWGKDIWSGN